MTSKLNNSLLHLELPERMRNLPVNERGYPVPKFVKWIDGKPDFRVIESEHLVICVRHRRCWICGHSLGKHMTFAIGPMCVVNRISSEPPSHLACAEYAAKACPFLANPRMRRNDKDMPDGGVTAGIAIERNPGVSVLWTTLSYRVFQPGNGGVLFEIGAPEHIEFYREGRRATHGEIMHSIETGLPLLREMAKRDGPEAIKDLDGRIARLNELVPA